MNKQYNFWDTKCETCKDTTFRVIHKGHFYCYECFSKIFKLIKNT